MFVVRSRILVRAEAGEGKVVYHRFASQKRLGTGKISENGDAKAVICIWTPEGHSGELLHRSAIEAFLLWI